MTDEQLAELEALEKAATPGPWRVSMSGYSVKSYDAGLMQLSSKPGSMRM